MAQIPITDIALTADIEPLPPIDALALDWRALEGRAEGAFFTSWSWIGPWLEMAVAAGRGHSLSIVRVRDSGSATVGLGVVCLAERSLRTFGRRRFLLHQTGVQSLDAIYIEYNDFLVATSVAVEARAACLRVVGIKPGIDIHAATPACADSVATAGLQYRASRVETCSVADLSKIGATPGVDGVLESLGRNSRQQIRRAIKLAEANGPLQLARATGLVEARQWLLELIDLHARAWTERKGERGAFANRDLSDFVSRLIEVGVESGAVDLLRIGTPLRPTGFLLNFVHRGEVYAYQSGFDYTDDNRFKPGLVSHALALAYYKARGCRVYHFMAGESRYKQSLSNDSENMMWLEVRKHDLIFHTENFARYAWHGLRRVLRPAN